MLLRRVIEHVRDQNWTAAVLDFLIVVIGVFIGIQVANWNDQRAERQQESFFLNAFREDVVVAEQVVTRLADLHLRQHALLSNILDTVAGTLPPRDWTEDDCFAIGISHVT